MTKTLVNPSARPIRLVLDDGTEHIVPAWGMVRLEQKVERVEVVELLFREIENNAETTSPASAWRRRPS